MTRGYTFHEQLDPVDLVHMNGRVYDPTIGRFLSADPFVQDITNTQALNAYSYVLNNPLSYTDPSGFFFSKIFKAIGNAFRAIGRAFMHAVRAIARSSIGRAILQIAACANPAAVLTCAPAAAGLVLAAGGTLKEALISAALSFAQIGTSFGGAIDIWGSVGDFVQQTGLGLVGKALTHGVVAGSLSMAQGGSFESGFFSGALSAGVGGVAGDVGIQDFGSRTVISVVVGGTTSVLSGGKFANGAVTAAFATMFNDMHHERAIATGAVVGPVAIEAVEGNPIAGFTLIAAGIGGAIKLVYDVITTPYGGVVYNSDAPNTLNPGPYADDSIPARGPGRDFTPEERDAINEIGGKSGCHSCGTRNPGTKSGNFIPDHQPPSALNPSGAPQRLYPHCLTCSQTQGGQVRHRKP